MRRQVVASSLFILALPVLALAQAPPTPQPADQLPAGPFEMPPVTVTVTALKETTEAQKSPVSVTAITGDVLSRSGAATVSDSSMFSPNTFFSELTARKISNATFRGIGSSPANPGITTFIDGVPQLNTNSSSLTLADIGQIEFVRGSGSSLFGRNTLGGLINITSRRPRMGDWAGEFRLPFGTEASRGIQGSFSGPIKTNKAALSFAFDYGQRDGFSTNPATGNDLDNREAFSGKAQLLWTPNALWETRVITGIERDRDGDYALSDLAGLREDPFTAMRDFEGRTDRDVYSTTFTARRQGPRVVFSSTTGFVKWNAQDLTDLDYTAAPLITRNNLERDVQFTEELRWASEPAAPIALSDAVDLRWQAGVFLFTQQYKQDAVNSYGPFVLSQFVDFSTDQHSPRSTLDDLGLGLFGQATFVVRDRVDLGVGARFDREQKEGTLESFFEQGLPGSTRTEAERTFSRVSPQVSAAFHVASDRMLYVSAGEGFKAGGFNPQAPQGNEAYGEERAWHFEGGWKSSWADGKFVANASVFAIDWKDMQLNVPDTNVPGLFYIANVGGATSRGVELELMARPTPAIGVFASIGQTRARFTAGSTSNGMDVGGHKLQNAPDFTAAFGAEVVRRMTSAASWFARGEVVSFGAFQYDPSNTAGQDAYSLVNLRGGFRRDRLLIEGWVRNALDTRYIPIAFPYYPLAPSGFIGEPGRPRTAGVTVGVGF